jgi:CDP-diacylglycerol--glycerol-3-phosphate 3-phosphatidyltransferase
VAISNESRSRIKKVFEPIALGMGRLGLTPDGLTLIGFGITAVGAVLVAQQLWLLGGLVIFLGGAFDMFDGTLARATGRVSKLGEFMDSVFDRAGEALVYLGIIAGFEATGWAGSVLFAAGAMGAAFMVSYTRAKSDGLGFTAGSGMAAVGIMPREARLVVLCLGLILAGALGTTITVPDGGFQGAGGAALPLGMVAIEIALAIIAVGASITVIQRILHVRSQAKSATIPH